MSRPVNRKQKVRNMQFKYNLADFRPSAGILTRYATRMIDNSFYGLLGEGIPPGRMADVVGRNTGLVRMPFIPLLITEAIKIGYKEMRIIKDIKRKCKR